MFLFLEEKTGLKFNDDFFVGYSPERINPGDKKHTITKITKVVSGSTPKHLKNFLHYTDQLSKLEYTRHQPSKQLKLLRL